MARTNQLCDNVAALRLAEALRAENSRLTVTESFLLAKAQLHPGWQPPPEPVSFSESTAVAARPQEDLAVEGARLWAGAVAIMGERGQSCDPSDPTFYGNYRLALAEASRNGRTALPVRAFTETLNTLFGDHSARIAALAGRLAGEGASYAERRRALLEASRQVAAG